MVDERLMVGESVGRAVSFGARLGLKRAQGASERGVVLVPAR